MRKKKKKIMCRVLLSAWTLPCVALVKSEFSGVLLNRFALSRWTIFTKVTPIMTGGLNPLSPANLCPMSWVRKLVTRLILDI